MTPASCTVDSRTLSSAIERVCGMMDEGNLNEDDPVAIYRDVDCVNPVLAFDARAAHDTLKQFETMTLLQRNLGLVDLAGSEGNQMKAQQIFEPLRQFSADAVRGNDTLDEYHDSIVYSIAIALGLTSEQALIITGEANTERDEAVESRTPDLGSGHQDRSAIYTRPQRTQPDDNLRRCDCGHTIQLSLVMNTSRGSSCPYCYDRMSD